jgi:hypothetical protein
VHIPSSPCNCIRYHRSLNCLRWSSLIALEWRGFFSGGYSFSGYDGETTFSTSYCLLRNLQVLRWCSVGQLHEERTRFALSFIITHAQLSDKQSEAPANHLFSPFPLKRQQPLLLHGRPNLEILHPLYDLTPPTSITAVVTEVGLIPPSSISSIPLALGRQTL